MYDAIVVGARCAGSPTAMLLAREGLKVLLLDRDTFPSDIMSTHYIHPPGVGLLGRWGVLERVLASNCPPIRQATFAAFGQASKNPVGQPLSALQDAGSGADGQGPFGLCPRRRVIDKMLVDAAVAAGAELREDFHVHDVLRDEAGAVTGVAGRNSKGAVVSEAARIVIGADGLHSRLARLVEPPEYNRFDTVICAYYSYFSGLETDGIELYGQAGAGVLLFPTNDGLACIAAARPRSDFDEYRTNIETTFLRTIDAVGFGLGERVRAAKREERFLGSGDLPQYFRKPYGPGWALVGDAGLHIDPTQGLGITKAFSEVSMLAPALAQGLAGTRPLDECLAEFHAARDRVWVPMAQQNVAMSCGISGAAPPVIQPWSEAVQPAAASN